MPRHPPLALSSLSIKPDKTNLISFWWRNQKQTQLLYTPRYPWHQTCGGQDIKTGALPNLEDLGLLYYLIIKDRTLTTSGMTS